MLQDDLWEQILGNLSPNLALLVHGVTSRTGSCLALPSPAHSSEELTPNALRRLIEDYSSALGPHMGPP